MQGILAERFHEIRKQSERICAPLKPEDYVVQPVVDVSPPKWHLGHTTWFFEEFVLSTIPGYERFHPEYQFVFNSYYESIGTRVLRTDRGNLSRPTVDEVLAYREHVTRKMLAYLTGDDVDELLYPVIELGMQHEQQHQELLAYDIKYILGNNPLFPAYQKSVASDSDIEARPAEWLSIQEGIYEIGHASESFCFDNELGQHKVYLEAFEVQDRLVTNGEYLAFVEGGGYQDFQHWLAEAWDWVNREQIQAPFHWHKVDDVWMHYTMQGLKPLDLSAPVTHVSYYEADAYSAWAGCRLLTEFEWEVAAKKYEASAHEDANFAQKGVLQPLAAKKGHLQFLGDAWEWTGSAYLPYPKFLKAPGAIGEYNGKFMINQMVLRGGSCATPEDHIRHTYRNFFHPHLRWHFTGIRLAKNG